MSDKKKSLEVSLEFMVRARALDTLEQEYTARGEAFFHVSGGGHEGIAVINNFLIPQDWIHAHYRDKSLLLARGVSLLQYFLALFNKDGAHSRGRQMNAHMSSPEHHILSLVGPVGNSQLQAAGIAAAIKDKKERPIVLSNVGDGTTAQGEFLEGLTLSIRDRLPLITIIEDNNYAISTFTKGKTFYQVGDTQVDNFMGCPIIRMDGRTPHELYDNFEALIQETRSERTPKIIVLTTERLDNHTNADDQKIYRDKKEIELVQKTGDPIILLIKYLYQEDDEQAAARLQDLIQKEIDKMRPIAEEAQRSAEPKPLFSAKAPFPKVLEERASEDFKDGPEAMITALRNVLDEWLKNDPRIFLYGEDLEDPKGDVFGLTRGLSTAYPNRVVNSPLSESTIVGSCVGRALAGQRPIAFLQFADFIPLIANQLYAELGSMYWRTDGGWRIPVIVMATTGGYKPGLGPFHASSFEAFVSHIPGIDVYSPSNAADAAGLLNAALLSERPTVFFYPKNLLNTKTRNIEAQSARKFVVMPGKARTVEEGDDITLVGYGNTVPLCEKAAKSIREAGKSAEVIDLRTISPLDFRTIIESAKKTGRVLAVHEENGSMGVASELLARISSELDSIKLRRVTRRDTYVPCNFVNQLEVLPSYKRILEEAVETIGGRVEWILNEEELEGVTAITAVGASPSDETFTVVEWKIKAGDTIAVGDLIAEAEANKADISVKSVVSGVVEEILVQEGETVDIGSKIALIKSEDKIYKTVTKEITGTPKIDWYEEVTEAASEIIDHLPIKMGYPSSVLGSRIVSNKELVSMSQDWDEESIVASTGIYTRHWIGKDQTIVSMPAEAARKSLKKAGLSITDITGIICATGTSEFHTPSVAAQVQYDLLLDIQDEHARSEYKGYAYDISAACSGFVYALSDAYAKVKLNPNEKILVLTSEVLSQYVDLNDYQTAPIFADAGCACIVGTNLKDAAELKYPVLESIGEPATSLTVHTKEPIHMDGIEVYKVAVANLIYIAEKICRKNNIELSDIDLIVPHQANLKIIKGVARRLKVDIEKFYVNIDRHGNTSSCTIPICLDELLSADKLAGKKVMLIAFGGGYTFGASILQY